MSKTNTVERRGTTAVSEGASLAVYIVDTEEPGRLAHASEECVETLEAVKTAGLVIGYTKPTMPPTSSPMGRKQHITDQRILVDHLFLGGKREIPKETQAHLDALAARKKATANKLAVAECHHLALQPFYRNTGTSTNPTLGS